MPPDVGARVPPIEKVMSGLALRNLSFKNASVHVRYTDHSIGIKGAPSQDKVQVADATFDRSGNAYIDLVDSMPDDTAPGHVERRMTMTVNEKGGRYLRPSKTGRLFGTIEEHKTYYWAVEPAQLCFLLRWSPDDYLKKVGRVVVDGTELMDGVETVRIAWEFESTGPDAPGSGRKGLFWVQPSRGYAVVRSEEQARAAPNSPWQPFMFREWKSMSKVGDVWLPGKVTYREMANFTGRAPEIVHEATAIFDRWKVNQRLPKAVFELKFPDKTWVTDRVNGRTYVKGAITDRKIAGQVRLARQTAAGQAGDSAGSSADVEARFKEAILAHSGGPSSGRWPLWTLLGAFCICSLAFVGMWIRKASRGRER
ncbi:MAG: hypothetical protein ACP5XB_15530 [Isosphaeraceae bacterium]